MSAGLPPDLAPRLVAWQRAHGRHDLPWQGSRDAYRVWLSEIMLQQTQVATVLAYFPRFLARFPDVQALASGSLNEVLALWSGLGYYSRARNLHRCARLVVDEHGGVFPRRSEDLAALPGIGRSTAAAIAAFCFGEKAAILDGNVRRVLCRVLGFDADLARAAAQRELWAQAQALLPEQDIEAYTQGLMDLGATLCSTRRPDCARCPLAALCSAQQQGRPESFPVKTRRASRGRRDNTLLHLVQGDQVWLVQRPGRGVWAGLFSLPAFDTPDELARLTAPWPGQGWACPVIDHALTHFDWRLRPWRHELPPALGVADRAAVEASLPAGAWVARDHALTMGLPAPIRRLLAAV